MMRFFVTVFGVMFTLNYLFTWTLVTMGMPEWIIVIITFGLGVLLGRYFYRVRRLTEQQVRQKQQ